MPPDNLALQQQRVSQYRAIVGDPRMQGPPQRVTSPGGGIVSDIYPDGVEIYHCITPNNNGVMGLNYRGESRDILPGIRVIAVHADGDVITISSRAIQNFPAVPAGPPLIASLR